MIQIRCEDCGSLIDPVRFAQYTAEKQPLLDIDHSEEYPDSLGWLDVDRWAGETLRTEMKEIAQKVRSIADVFAVVGIGGSNQGARAVIDALAYRDTEGPEIIYPALFLSAAEFQRLMKYTEGKSLVADIIAKNFKTLEPGVGFRMLRDVLAARYGAENLRERFIVTPTPGLDALDALADQ